MLIYRQTRFCFVAVQSANKAGREEISRADMRAGNPDENKKGRIMSRETNEKTNVMRVLEQKKISFVPHYYEDTGAVSGMEVAQVLGEEPDRVFKTLVCVAPSKKYYVFMVPVNCELNLKKAAKAAGEKSIEMIKAKELLGLTGYIHGGCSPIGMKKLFVTFIHESASNYETIMYSAGKIGYQVETAPGDISKVIPIVCADIV